MIQALVGFGAGLAVAVAVYELLWVPPTWMSFTDVYEQAVGGGLRLDCSRCCATSHVMPGTRVRDAVASRMQFLRQHVLCAGVNDDRGEGF